MKKFSLLLMVSFIVLCSCTNDTSSNSSSSVDSSTQQSNQQNSNYTTNEYKIESSGSFEIDYVSYQYPTLKKTVNNATTSVTLNNEIVVSSGCKWTLSKDIEGTNLIKTKNMSLTEGHNYAYITVWDASEEHNAIYYVDVYRLSMFTYQFYDGDKLIKSDVIEENQSINLPNSEVEKTGYSFECWVDENGTEVTFPYVIKSDINFYTKWNVNQYTINFDSDGGNTISSLTCDYGTSIMLPIPEKKGYQFVGWVNNDIILENNLVVCKNLDLIAYWIDDNLNYVINDDYKTITLLSVKNINNNSTYFIPSYVSAIKSGLFENESSIIIYCETISQPSTWESGWNGECSVYYGITKDNKVEKDGIIYVIKDDEAIVTRYVGNDTNVTISNTIEFNGNTYDVTTIGKNSFSNCTSLTSITIPSSVTTIGNNVFNGCSSLTIYCETESQPSGWDSDWNGGSPVYYGITKDNKIEKDGIIYVIQNDEVIITEYLGNDSNVIIPNTIELNNKTYKITALGEYLFLNCTSLKKVTIPNNVTKIGSSAFRGCTSLEKITLQFVGGSKDSNTYLGYIFGAPSYRDNSKYVPSSLKEVVVLEGCTSIEANAFRDCTSLTSITIPSSVTTIKNHAFFGCTSLKNVYYEGTIEDWCNIEFDSSPMYYAKHFYMLSSNNVYEEVTSLEIPNTVTNIGDYQFDGFNNVTSITISSSVTTIGDYAFYGCNSLTSITIPSSVTTIGKYAFSGCTSLEKITLPFIGASQDATGNNAKLSYIFGAVPSSLKEVVILVGCSSIVEYAFSECTFLTNIVIPSSVTTIGMRAFENCTSLTSIIIPSSVTEIGGYAFENCYSLTIYCETESQPSGWDSNWNGSDWPVYYGITKENKIEKEGIIYVIQNNKAIVTRYVGNDTNVTIPSDIELNGKTYNVTKIGKRAFSACTFLTSVIIPSSVTIIGESAFCGCTSLASITIPNSVTTIGAYAFWYCASLTSITIPNSVTKIGYYAFYNCSSLTIYCEATSQPSGWSSSWNPNKKSVFWGVKR